MHIWGDSVNSSTDGDIAKGVCGYSCYVSSARNAIDPGGSRTMASLLGFVEAMVHVITAHAKIGRESHHLAIVPVTNKE